MRQTLVLLAITGILFLMVKRPNAAAGVPGIGDALSLSVTNKYGDVLVDPTVAQILSDGLVLQRGTTEMKVKYEELPPDIGKKYQSLAKGVIQSEEKKGAVDAAYFAYTQQLQAEDTRHLAAQEKTENELARERPAGQSTNVVHCISIAIPGQNWKLTVANLGFGEWRREESNGKIALRGLPGPTGFSLGIFIEPPMNDLPGNDAVYNYFWLNMGHDSLIDNGSVKVEKNARYIKVSYTARGEPNVNYFFAYQNHWVDLHLAKPSLEPGDERLLADFDSSLSYGE